MYCDENERNELHSYFDLLTRSFENDKYHKYLFKLAIRESDIADFYIKKIRIVILCKESIGC